MPTNTWAIYPAVRPHSDLERVIHAAISFVVQSRFGLAAGVYDNRAMRGFSSV